ncbi:uncharacterized protein MYCFIDRAFT_206647 [Pseudocercospora fijiensis CIRAD86]|uniref:Uncharacterized protein n=1 Tax=Pseudocercospora fijiensis (strain CIRAD86) TaxID=383855 RepID=M3B966_PSEFD|nr:uncharacterized protein MYCFIDRAFT_206647 [Pseudocercospora fijiensis CIRAD86]EME85877.1 hypothetical protein MYCFIDRAFT_206647 [Pseudocercospora fijiensis CIRAD86]
MYALRCISRSFLISAGRRMANIRVSLNLVCIDLIWAPRVHLVFFLLFLVDWRFCRNCRDGGLNAGPLTPGPLIIWSTVCSLVGYHRALRTAGPGSTRSDAIRSADKHVWRKSDQTLCSLPGRRRGGGDMSSCACAGAGSTKRRQQDVLTALQNHRPSHLFTLMEESPAPPVPPKDPEYQYQNQNHFSSSMDIDRPPTARSSAPASGSKRKRESHHSSARLDVTDADDEGHTPSKRSRSNVRSDGDYDPSDETPAQQRNLRRKNGIRNLSNLNLRHAASTQTPPRPQSSPLRESKFQEGSLNDKPSEKPPSVFTRLPTTDSGNLEYVEELMADYHDGLPTPSGSVERVLEHEKATMPQRDKENRNLGMFRFGKSWASSFRPVALWNRLWNDTKDELTRQNMLDAEKKARMKAEAEARYAQLKNAGQLGLQPVSAAASRDLLATPYDSAVALDNGTGEHRRNFPAGAQLRPSNETSRDGSEAPEPPKTIRGRLSRLHLRKPSMSSLTGTVKRTKSDLNLGGAADRESSSSVSPTKATFDEGGSLLRRSHSKYDMKKQNRLSKRVSDLETKLNKARAELDTALAEASPMPKLGNKYERFTPVGTIKRSKFVPGMLPTLPSERLLFQDMKSEAIGPTNASEAANDRRPRNAIDLETAFDDIDDDETVKRPRSKTYPALAEKIFQENSSQAIESEQHSGEQTNVEEGEDVSDEFAPNVTDDIQDNDGPEPTNKSTNDALDAKLKALDASVKASKRSARLKKRPYLIKDDSGTFRPGRNDEADDDAEWEEAEKAEKNTKKKRKSTGEAKNSPQTKRASASGKQKSPQTKLVKKATATTVKSTKKATGGKAKEKASASQIIEDVEMDDTLQSEDELANTNARNSIDAETQSLDPLYEEEEEFTTQQLKDEPSEPTATATPAKYERNAVRSRPRSPLKRAERGAEEKMMVLAAKAVVQSRPSRSASPPPTAHSKKAEVIEETISIIPGQDGVPNLPKGVNSSLEQEVDAVVKKGGKRKNVSQEKFEWPDDVF